MDFPGLVGPRFDPGSVRLVGAGPAQRRIGQIAARLIEAGRDRAEPVAPVSNAIRADQDVQVSALAEAGSAVAGIPAGAATLIPAGPVIALLAEWQQPGPMTVQSRDAGSAAWAKG